MTELAAALVPTFAIIVLGALLRHRGFLPEVFWPGAERLTYYVLFPCLLAVSVADAELDPGALLPMAGALVFGVLGMAALLLASRPLLAVAGPAFSSIFQGVIRPNTFVGLAAAYGLFGPEGVTLIAIGIASVVPLVNVLCVAVLVRYGDTGRAAVRNGVATTAIALATNPLIMAVGIGLALQLSGIGLPPLIGPVAEVLGRAALPVGLLAVGAGLDLRAVRRAGGLVGLGTVAKLLVTPGLTLLGCALLGVDGLQAAVAVLYNGLPTAASAYVLARQMGGDAVLMAGIITASTIAAAATMPLVVIVAGLVVPGG